MQTTQFLNDLFKKIWKYIINDKEFEYLSKDDEDGNYDYRDFYADEIPKLIKSLSEDYSFYEVGKEMVSAISDLPLQKLIMDFIFWYGVNEQISSYDIYYNDDLDTSPLHNLIKYVEKHPIREIEIEIKEEKVGVILKCIERFTSATHTLKHRRKNKQPIVIEDEFDIQDILHLMLKPFFPNLKSEEVVEGNDERKFLKIDFLIRNEKIALETKFIRDKSHAQNISKEINDDIQTYHKHQNCDTLVFFIYDEKLLIKNADSLEDNYSRPQTFGEKKLNIILKIRPKN